MSIKIIAFDLDGTLLNGYKGLSKRTVKALTDAAAVGIYLVPATGRTYAEIPKELREKAFIRYVIVTNGAAIYDAETRQILHKEEMDRVSSERMLTYMKKLPAALSCAQNGKSWFDINGRTESEGCIPVQAKFFSKAEIDEIHFQMENMRENIFQYGETIEKLQMFFSNSRIRDMYLKEMLELFPEYAVSYSMSNNIEINALKANKGSALQWLFRYLGIAREESAAFGDGINDISMLREAGLGVAMANAEPAVLSAADTVTDSCDEDGVAVMIEKILSEI